MNTRHAQLVLAVAREGSFTAAAKSLFIAQPTLSQQIRQIEQQLGAPIFERGTTPVSLTPAGQIYVQAARRFLQIETQMNESIAALSGHTAGLLRLGLPQQRADELLPQVFAEFQSVYPEVCVQAVSLPNGELERKLLGSELDMALVSGEAENEKLEYQLIASDEVVLLAGRKTRLAQRIPSGSTISLNACEGEKFILPTESLPFTRSYDELLARAGLSPFVVLRTDDSQCAKRVCAGHLQKPWKEKADGAPAPSVCQPISRRIISAASALVVVFCLPFCFFSRAGLPKSGSRFSRAC